LGQDGGHYLPLTRMAVLGGSFREVARLSPSKSTLSLRKKEPTAAEKRADANKKQVANGRKPESQSQP